MWIHGFVLVINQMIVDSFRELFQKQGYVIDFLDDQLQHTNGLFIGSSHQPLNGGECFYITLDLSRVFLIDQYHDSSRFFYLIHTLIVLDCSTIFIHTIILGYSTIFILYLRIFQKFVAISTLWKCSPLGLYSSKLAYTMLSNQDVVQVLIHICSYLRQIKMTNKAIQLPWRFLSDQLPTKQNFKKRNAIANDQGQQCIKLTQEQF